MVAELLPEQPFTWRKDSHCKERLDRVAGVSGWTHHDFRRVVATVLCDELVDRR
jgi:hypothetical protein